MNEKLGPCVLDGRFVRLEPLKKAHFEALLDAGKGFDWAWLSSDLSTRANVDEWIASALHAEEVGEEHPFVVYLKSANRIVGSTRYMDIQTSQKGVEIGWTWYSPRVWGSAVNPECKFLLLKHAFEDWEAIRVQLKTDNMNLHSQNAILKLGAKFEGTLRNHRIRRDRTFRHTMMYSITIEEWPNVKGSLVRRLEEFGN